MTQIKGGDTENDKRNEKERIEYTKVERNIQRRNEIDREKVKKKVRNEVKSRTCSIPLFRGNVVANCHRSFLALATPLGNGLITLTLKLKFIFLPEIAHIDRKDTKVTYYIDSDATSKT